MSTTNSELSPISGQEIPRREFIKTGVAAALALSALPGTARAEKAPAAPAIASIQRARNIIFCVSDGMSAGVLAMAEAFSQLTRGRGTNWYRLMRQQNAVCGLMDTASRNSLVTDSAAASSAWSSGVRVNNGFLNTLPDGTTHTPIGVRFHEAGKKFGLVTTATITHATPAGFAVCESSRGEENRIAEKYPGLVDVALGGGRSFFDPEQRPDRRDLWEEARKLGYRVCLTRDELLAAGNSGRLFGTFSNSHLPYVIDRPNFPGWKGKIPSLSEMTAAALPRMVEGSKGFLLQIEGARVDHAAHHNDIAALLHEQLDFDDALGLVLEFAEEHEDTLVIVTSDHGNSNPGLNGMGTSYSESTETFAKVAKACESFSAISVWAKGRLTRPSGLSRQELSAKTSEALGFALADAEADVLLRSLRDEPAGNWNAQLANFWGLMGEIAGNHTGVGWTGTTHTSDPTVLTAFGPGCGEFHGFFRNDEVCQKLLKITGLA